MGEKENQYERGEILTISTYNEQHAKYIKEMQDYIQSFKKMDESAAKVKAKESLIRSGVLKKDGTTKDILLPELLIPSMPCLDWWKCDFKTSPVF